MANQVAARLAGDDYQHLLAWNQMLLLRKPNANVREVIVEDPDAAHVDDVTTLFQAGTGAVDVFEQVKYHVDQRGDYSTDYLLEKETPKSRSLLEKFFFTWRKLVAATTDRSVMLRLTSNWSWDGLADVRSCVQGKNAALSEEFFTAGARSKIGIARERWRAHLGIGSGEFEAFARTLRFRLGYDCFEEFADRVAERMENLGLRHDDAALKIAAGIVRDLIKVGDGHVDRARLDQLLEHHQLIQAAEEPSTVIYLTSVKTQEFEVPPDIHIDWRAHFTGDPMKKGHAVNDPRAWNDLMLPELHKLESDLNAQRGPRLIRARGLARLSPWFAFGHTFSDVARYTIELDQNGSLWRTDATATDLKAIETGRERLDAGDGASIAVGISVTGSLEADVRAYLAATGAASATLFLQPNRGLGRTAFTSAGDVVGFAKTAKELMRAFVKAQNATRLLLFYFGPISGACFLGHQLNAVAREIQVMEDQQPGYEPSFLLR